MKLKQIKLAGFKSFVDPTTIEFKSQLVGVVGPNGCGKSNVIDAVRWVMGESSAKHLRGESITDVIFNGSVGRKPVGQASIDLVFDNADGALGGEYAQYAEISIRRQVTRDGQSNYYLNGTKCRRKDILEVFMGTGLGPRGYSIIEQGMISQVIAAKPEELRKFIEEAAGISTYKRKRHESELRLTHTRDNLEVVGVQREEQVKLLDRLARQSDAARQFNTLDGRKTELEQQLLALRWQNFDQQIVTITAEIRTQANGLEAILTDRASLDAALEHIRVSHGEKAEVFNTVQGRHFEIGRQLARQEQVLASHQERQAQLTQDVQAVLLQIQEISQQKQADSGAITDLQQRLQAIGPEYELAQAALETAELQHQEAKEKMEQWTLTWDQIQADSQTPREQAEALKATLQQLDKQGNSAHTRMDRLEDEYSRLDIAAANDAVTEQRQQVQQLEAEVTAQNQAAEQAQAECAQLRQQHQQLSARRDELNVVRQEVRGRIASLEALQQAALARDETEREQWLATQDLADCARLVERLQVRPGWEKAVEMVLQAHLAGLCLPNDTLPDLTALPGGQFAFHWEANLNVPSLPAGSLAELVSGSHSVQGLLATVFVAEDLAAALAWLPQAEGGQSVITPDGVWLGAGWARVCSDVNEQSVLKREQALQAQTAELATIEAELTQVIAQAEALQTQLADREQQAGAYHREAQLTAQTLREASANLSRYEAKAEQQTLRQQHLQQEMQAHREQIQAVGEESAILRLDLEAAIDNMAQLTATREAHAELKADIQAQLNEVGQHLTLQRNTTQQLAIEHEGVKRQHQATLEAAARTDKQLAGLLAQQQQLERAQAEAVDPGAQISASIETLVEQQMEIESELEAARIQMEQDDLKVKAHETERQALEAKAGTLREKIEEKKLSLQTLTVRKQTIDEQLAQLSLAIEQILENLPDACEEPHLEQEIEELAVRIQKLGAINLAAIDEYEAEKERQQYLKSQFEDLTEAVATLEAAIKKIDKETRSKFKQTFEQINQNFTTLFPRLFGGGEASMQLTDDDLLEAGVTVMAQPPGKRNSSIHLLSGGEKALTAVALVFAIFQINPAPFCMLDEVDAPLDDANVGRFCKLIQHMADKVQFIFISHNKLTMEIADQLAGVTMKEPGVSRLVSVDLERAFEMAEA